MQRSMVGRVPPAIHAIVDNLYLLRPNLMILDKVVCDCVGQCKKCLSRLIGCVELTATVLESITTLWKQRIERTLDRPLPSRVHIASASQPCIVRSTVR